MRQKSSVSLKEFSTIQIGGIAEKVYFPENISEFCELLKTYPTATIVGGGSNVYFTEKIYPVVICTKLLQEIKLIDKQICADCGVKLGELFDFAAGVPATVGGGVLLNFGAFGKEIKDYLISVEIFDQTQGSISIPKEKIKFAYRYSSLHQEKKIILRATFIGKDLLKKTEFLTKRKNLPYYKYPSLGSVFKNPPGESAGRLIEQCGLKGKTCGDLKISEHANIIINTGKATSEDMKKLINEIKSAVQAKFGILLEEEIECLE